MEFTEYQPGQHGYRHWLGTWFNFPSDWMLQLCKANPTFFAAQEEICPETKKQHIQLYAYFSNGLQMKTITKRLPGLHWIGIAPSQAQQVYKYCTLEKPDAKKDTIVPGTSVEWGKKPHFEMGSKANSAPGRDWQATLEHCIAGTWENSTAEHQVKYLGNLIKLSAHYSKGFDTEDVRGIWIYGETGSGKSHYAREAYGLDFYVKAQSKWWCNYRGEAVVILDDFDHQGSCLGHYLKLWADKYACKGETKGGTVALRHTHFIITSQYLPDHIWPGDQQAELRAAITRRFKFYHMVGRKISELKESEYISSLVSFINN